MKKERMKVLPWFDLIVVTIIMFASGVYNSTVQYMALVNNTVSLEENLTFSPMQNYKAMAVQFSWLLLAGLYLFIRRFDFSVLTKKIKFTWWLPIQAIGFFAIAALAMDIYNLINYNLQYAIMPSMSGASGMVDISLVLYSLLNGFYEEIFFLGLCLAVKPEHTKWAFIYSLIVRFSFHTYQGIATALGIGIVLGTVFFILYKKLKYENMLPFFLAHAIADIIGLSVIFYFV